MDNFDIGGYFEDVESVLVTATGYIKPWMRSHKFELVKSVEELKTLVDAAIAHGSCSLDLETEGLDNRIYEINGRKRTVHEIVGFCISIDGSVGYYIPVRHRVRAGLANPNLPIEDAEEQIRRLCLAAQPVVDSSDPLGGSCLEPPRLVIYFWHARFDQEFLYPITGIDWWHPASFEDGLLCAFVLDTDDDGYGLKYQAEKLLGYEMIELTDLFPKARRATIKFAELCPDEVGTVLYGASDGICTVLCVNRLLPKVLEDHGAMYRLEKQVTQVVRVMERLRLKINRQAAIDMVAPHEERRNLLLAKISEFAKERGWSNFSPASTPDLSEFLFGSRWLNLEPKPPKGDSGRYSTKEEHVVELAEELGAAAPEILRWVLEFRGEEKMLGTYLCHFANNYDKYSESDSEMRVQLKQTGARTGRFSSPAGEPDQGYSGLPWHGIPKESTVRNCLIARPGYALIKADYSGQEVGIAANLSGEPIWIKEFTEGAGDIHTITAKAFFGEGVTKEQRNSIAKPSLFAVMYGGGPKALSRIDGCSDAEAKRRHNILKSSYPTYFNFVEKSLAKAKKEAGVYTAFGRWLSINDFKLKAGDVVKGERLLAEDVKRIEGACRRFATNGPIQGSGADILKIAMVLLYKAFYKAGWLQDHGDDSVRMLHTVHDELIFEVRYDRVREAIPTITDLMKKPGNFTNPKYSPPWKVVLVAEPQIGFAWGAGYAIAEMKPGHKLKPTEVLQNGFVYSLTRRVGGLGEVQDYEVVVEETPKGVIVRMREPPPWIDPGLCQSSAAAPVGAHEVGVQVEKQSVKTPEESQEKSLSASSKVTPVETKSVSGQIVVVRILEITALSAKQVGDAITASKDPDGSLLRLESVQGPILLDPRRNPMRVNLTKFMQALAECRLSDGTCSFM